MGIAHVIGKPVILIAQKEEDVPFDIGHLRYIKYNYTPRGMQEFEKNLKSAFKKLTDHEYKLIDGTVNKRSENCGYNTSCTRLVGSLDSFI